MNYISRLYKERDELDDRVEKLEQFLSDYEAGILKHVPSCPMSLMYEQLDVMKHYMSILDERLEFATR